MPEVSIIGELIGCIGFDSRPVVGRWRIVTGADRWRLLQGQDSGTTWLATHNNDDGPDDLALWNQPLDVRYACLGIQGWPKLFVSVYQLDDHGRLEIAGYGWCCIPVSSGLQDRVIACSRPRGSFIQNLNAYFLGGRPRYENEDVVLEGDSRFLHHTLSTGQIHVQFSVITQHLSLYHVFAADRYGRDQWHNHDNANEDNDSIDQPPNHTTYIHQFHHHSNCNDCSSHNATNHDHHSNDKEENL